MPLVSSGGVLQSATLVNIAARGSTVPIIGQQAARAEVANAVDTPAAVGRITVTRAEALSAFDTSNWSGAVSQGWVVTPAPSFVEGVAGTYNIAATGPAGATPGGFYSIDPAGTQLPAGMTLSEAGILSADTTVQDGSLNGVIFNYTDQYALPIMTLESGPVIGSVPFEFAVFPCEGAVPLGATLRSPNEPKLRSVVTSRWPDNSAQVVVCHGHTTVAANTTKQITLRPSAAADSALLTVNYIDTLMQTQAPSGIEFSFGASNTSITDFSDTSIFYNRIWWRTSQLIIARYIVPLGLGVMDAIIDVHAYAEGRAFIEIVIENGRINANQATVVRPTTQNYNGATVTVDGALIITVNEPYVGYVSPNSISSPVWNSYSDHNQPFTSGHQHGRAWYCDAWVGGNPYSGAVKGDGIICTHDKAHLQALPFFFKELVSNPQSMSSMFGSHTYDTYAPWGVGRQKQPGQNSGGGSDEIAPYSQSMAFYILTASKYPALSALATCKSFTTNACHYRHLDGNMPTRAQMLGKNVAPNKGSTWPLQAGNEPLYCGGNEGYGAGGNASHVGAVGLIPFMIRPSPWVIEMCQAEAMKHMTDINSSPYDSQIGVHYYYQGRGRAWGLRGYAFCCFLTPDDHPNKALYRDIVHNEAWWHDQWFDKPWNLYKNTWDAERDKLQDGTTIPGFQFIWYFHSFNNHVANGIVRPMKLLRDPAKIALMEKYGDDLFYFYYRWFTDSNTAAWLTSQGGAAGGYEWRIHPGYQTTVGMGVVTGGNITSINELAPTNTNNVIDKWNWKNTNDGTDLTQLPPTTPGPWGTCDSTKQFTWSAVNKNDTAKRAGSDYITQTWGAVCHAVERGIPGSEEVFVKIYGTNGANGGINNFNDWKTGMTGTQAQWSRWPRNKVQV